MTSSDPDRKRAESIIASLLKQTAEEHLARRIDEPIDRAAEAFTWPADEAYTPERFQQTIAGFVQCLYRNTPFFGRTLTVSQAHDEAVALLTQGYRGEFFDGYHGAVTDAAYSTGSGMRLVRDRMKDLIKARLREACKRSVLLRHVDPADWQTRRAMATILFDGCRSYMPPALSRCSPDQFTDDVLIRLLEVYAAVRRG